MGFLLGAYGKQAAGSRMRSIQARMMRIQSRVRRVGRDIERMTKMLDRQEKSLINQATATVNAQKNMIQMGLMGAMYSNVDYATAMQTMQGKDARTEDISQAQTIAANIQSQFQQRISANNTSLDTMLAQQKQQIEDQIEQLREQWLEPLKDEQDDLQSEKDMLEPQYQLAKQDYEACQKMEADGAKQMAPNYTGQA